MSACAKWENQRLWKPVDNPCGKPSEFARARSTPLQEINLLHLAELVDALRHAVELLDAKVDALEYQAHAFVSIFDQPLSPTESLERLRELREQMI